MYVCMYVCLSEMHVFSMFACMHDTCMYVCVDVCMCDERVCDTDFTDLVSPRFSIS